MKSFLFVPVCLLACAAAPVPAAVTYHYAHPYYSSGDSPFYQGIVDGTIHLEDFEDYKLNTPHVTSTGGGWVADSPNLSVDGDDGVLNGRTSGGGCWTLRPSDHSVPEFIFSPNKDGLLPTYVGMALLRGRVDFSGGLTYTKIYAYDANGFEITNNEWKILLPLMPQSSFSSTSDTFVGIYFPEGVARIKIGWSLIDHLQYGYAIPEPSAAGLLAAAGCFGLVARRKEIPRRR